jgi:hypothetical protein
MKVSCPKDQHIPFPKVTLKLKPTADSSWVGGGRLVLKKCKIKVDKFYPI